MMPVSSVTKLKPVLTHRYNTVSKRARLSFDDDGDIQPSRKKVRSSRLVKWADTDEITEEDDDVQLDIYWKDMRVPAPVWCQSQSHI
jgi:hypothetical protein